MRKEIKRGKSYQLFRLLPSVTFPMTSSANLNVAFRISIPTTEERVQGRHVRGLNLEAQGVDRHLLPMVCHTLVVLVRMAILHHRERTRLMDQYRRKALVRVKALLDNMICNKMRWAITDAQCLSNSKVAR